MRTEQSAGGLEDILRRLKEDTYWTRGARDAEKKRIRLHFRRRDPITFQISMTTS
jgi:hypothetical protein